MKSFVALQRMIYSINAWFVVSFTTVIDKPIAISVAIIQNLIIELILINECKALWRYF